MSASSEAPQEPGGDTVGWVLAAALAFALSSGLYDLAQQWVLQPWSRYSAAFLFGTLWIAWKGPPAAARPTAGLAVLAAGLVLQLLAALSVMPSLGRPALVLAFFGLALWRGWAAPAVIALAIFIVPVPYQLTDWTGGDALAAELFRAAVPVVRMFGAQVAAGEHRVISGEADFEVAATQAGLPTLFALTGLLVFALLRPGFRSQRGFGWGFAWAVALFVGGAAWHFVSIVFACGALAAGSVGLAGFCVDTLSWIVPLGMGVAFVERAASTPTSDRTRRTTS